MHAKEHVSQAIILGLHLHLQYFKSVCLSTGTSIEHADFPRAPFFFGVPGLWSHSRWHWPQTRLCWVVCEGQTPSTGSPGLEGTSACALYVPRSPALNQGRKSSTSKKNICLCSRRAFCQISLSACAEVSVLSLGRNWLPNISVKRVEIGTRYFIICFVLSSFIP